MCDCENETTKKGGFQPDVAGKMPSKHVVRSLRQYMIATAIFWGYAIALLIQYPKLNPGDPNALLRWMAEGSIHIVFALTVAFGAIVYLQWKTNGNLLGRALSDAIACAIIFAVVFLGVVLLLIGC
jgi:hypothetical protein